MSADDPGRLTNRQDWSRQWERVEALGAAPDPTALSFRDLHALLRRHLPHSRETKFLELGCYPGGFMRYFEREFGYQVTGIEYVAALCERMRRGFEREGFPAEVIEADAFSYEPGDRRWGVVGSFGLVEHFDDPSRIIRRHLDLLSEGGYLVLTIPNHAGINGRILDWVDPEKSHLHNHMSYEDLERAVRSAGPVKILEGGYYGRFGFWNSGIYGQLHQKSRPLYLGARAVLAPLERIGVLLPDSRRFSPNAALIARKST